MKTRWFLACAGCLAINGMLASPVSAQLQAVLQQKIVPADASPDKIFGDPPAVDGDVLAIGATQDNDLGPWRGAVYVYVRTAGTWTFQQKLYAIDGFDNDFFGSVIDVHGDTIVVGVDNSDTAISMGFPVQDGGAVYIFDRPGPVWTLSQQLHSLDIEAGDGFGSGVGISGDTLVAGAGFSDDAGPGSGSAYVFTHDGTSWTQQAKLVANDAVAGDVFGASVRIDGDTITCSASGFDSDRGAVYVFTGSGTSWTQQAKIIPPDAAPNDSFGGFYDLDGDRIVVGVPNNDLGAIDRAGAVYVYDRTGTSWALTQKIRASDPATDLAFGIRVAVDGDRVLAGGFELSFPQSGSGSGYIYELINGTWTENVHFRPLDGAAEDRFSQGLTIAGDELFISAQRHNSNGIDDAGALYVYELQPTVYPAFCAGNGGDQMGCTDCPCSNNASTSHIGGCLNGAQQSATLAANGIASVGADSMRMRVHGANPQSFGLLASGNNALPNMGPCPPGSGILGMPAQDGLRCIGGAFQRHGTRGINRFGYNPNPWGPPGPPIGGLIAQGGFSAGQTRRFSVFYRDDVSSQCGTGTNTSNGVEVTFLP